ncbi:MAG: glycosyltransferase family 2 protein [Desulfohalobiaceae bacterium]
MQPAGVNKPEAEADSSRDRFAAVIPVYNHASSVEKVISATLDLGLPVFVVDDGCTDDTQQRISQFQDIRILRHAKNQGKGAALLTGFKEASRIADWAVSIDADGQHDPRDAAALIQAARNSRPALIVGSRLGMHSPNVKWSSRFGRKFSNFWVRVCGGPLISDSQSGFRVYPLPEALSLGVKARRFEFEVEILVRAHQQQLPVLEVPVGVHYLPPQERISHFRPCRDFFRNGATFSRLLLQRFRKKRG